MKDLLEIKLNIDEKRFLRNLKSKKKRKSKRRHLNKPGLDSNPNIDKYSQKDFKLIEKLPVNLKYLLSCEKSEFYIDKIFNDVNSKNGNFIIPKHFSIIDNTNESYSFIRNLIGAILNEKYEIINIDYKDCQVLELETQVLLDIILKDLIGYLFSLKSDKSFKVKVRSINGLNLNNPNIEKLLFSVGSPDILKNKPIKYSDIIPYKLCVHDRGRSGDPIKIQEQKDIDTTKLVDYVRTCLNKMNSDLTSERLEDLCTVIGEILINAEEHSSTKYRFSIGYFQEYKINQKHYGLFHLTILNFGETIYDKFKDQNCPNKEVTKRMMELSKQYTQKKYFLPSEFEEETLWTLYALQEGVSSIATDRYKKRGNGSIQFIESFFNIKGKFKVNDNISRMVLLSGNTKIVFDGTYNITEDYAGNDLYKYMTFNKSGNIEEMPDKKYVKYIDNYFPGTLISAKILFNEDDLT